jgi:hypothetical protein
MLGHLLGWTPCSFDRYQEACRVYGFNAESDPEFIRFQMELGAGFEFVECHKNGKLVGAACIDNGWLANDKTNPKRTDFHIPVPADAVYVPFKNNAKCIIPFHAKCLHPLNQGFLNSAFSKLSKRQICFAKSPLDGFSRKTVATRERETRRLQNAGGYFQDFSAFSPQQLQDIYWDLYKARRGEYPSDKQHNRLFFERFQQRLLGSVLFLHGEPCAMQLNVMTPSRKGLFVDYINMGLNQAIKDHSLGTILIWSNLKKAQKKADSLKLELHYSFGNPSAAYKERWCYQQHIGKILYL